MLRVSIVFLTMRRHQTHIHTGIKTNSPQKDGVFAENSFPQMTDLFLVLLTEAAFQQPRHGVCFWYSKMRSLVCSDSCEPSLAELSLTLKLGFVGASEEKMFVLHCAKLRCFHGWVGTKNWCFLTWNPDLLSSSDRHRNGNPPSHFFSSDTPFPRNPLSSHFLFGPFCVFASSTVQMCIQRLYKAQKTRRARRFLEVSFKIHKVPRAFWGHCVVPDQNFASAFDCTFVVSLCHPREFKSLLVTFWENNSGKGMTSGVNDGVFSHDRRRQKIIIFTGRVTTCNELSFRALYLHGTMSWKKFLQIAQWYGASCGHLSDKAGLPQPFDT